MAGLEAEERYREAGADGHAARRSAGAVHTGGDVDRNDWNVALVGGFDQRGHLAGDIAVETCAEQRVDDEAGVTDVGRNGFAPAFGVNRGVSPELRTIADEGGAHIPAHLAQLAGDHEAIAAIVAGTAKDEDRALAEAAHDLVRDRPARVLHQRQRRHARGLGQTVGAGHFSGREELVHGAVLAQTAPPSWPGAPMQRAARRRPLNPGRFATDQWS